MPKPNRETAIPGAFLCLAAKSNRVHDFSASYSF